MKTATARAANDDPRNIKAVFFSAKYLAVTAVKCLANPQKNHIAKHRAKPIAIIV
jgi:hypothetical protein